jgi:hypothetical protein
VIESMVRIDGMFIMIESVGRVAVVAVREGDVLVCRRAFALALAVVVGLARFRRRDYHFLPLVLPPSLDQSVLQASCVVDHVSSCGGNWFIKPLLITDERAECSCGPWLLDEPVDLIVQRLRALLRHAGYIASLGLLLELSTLLFANSGANHLCECTR